MESNSENKRKNLIKQIEEMRKSHVLTYVLSDREPFNLSIAEDAVRVLYQHIRDKSKTDKKSNKLDLFIYSRGGDTTVPWRLISMFREHYEEIGVLVPYKAYSAATMISMGADEILMGKKAELGPIDPTLSSTQRDISVEDVNSYISFIKDRVGIKNEEALAKMIDLLVNDVTPIVLGRVARTHEHIRYVAKKLLSVQKNKLNDQKISIIIETLCEKIYSHGHAIGRHEAKELGLPIKNAEEIKAGENTLEKLIWSLYLEYDKLMRLSDPIDLKSIVELNDDEEIKDLTLGAIESINKSSRVTSDWHIKRIRELPPNISIKSLNISFPEGFEKSENKSFIQGIVQKAVQGAMIEFKKNIESKCSIKNVNFIMKNKKWNEVNNW